METLIESLESSIEKKFSLDRLLLMMSVEVAFHITRPNRILENWLKENFKMQASKQMAQLPVDRPIWAIYHFYFKNPIDDSLFPPISDLIIPIEKAMMSSGVLKDKSQIYSYDLSRRLIGKTSKIEIFLLKDIKRVPEYRS